MEIAKSLSWIDRFSDYPQKKIKFKTRDMLSKFFIQMDGSEQDIEELKIAELNKNIHKIVEFLQSGPKYVLEIYQFVRKEIVEGLSITDFLEFLNNFNKETSETPSQNEEKRILSFLKTFKATEGYSDNTDGSRKNNLKEDKICETLCREFAVGTNKHLERFREYHTYLQEFYDRDKFGDLSLEESPSPNPPALRTPSALQTPYSVLPTPNQSLSQTPNANQHPNLRKRKYMSDEDDSQSSQGDTHFVLFDKSPQQSLLNTPSQPPLPVHRRQLQTPFLSPISQSYSSASTPLPSLSPISSSPLLTPQRDYAPVNNRDASSQQNPPVSYSFMRKAAQNLASMWESRERQLITEGHSGINPDASQHGSQLLSPSSDSAVEGSPSQSSSQPESPSGPFKKPLFKSQKRPRTSPSTSSNATSLPLPQLTKRAVSQPPHVGALPQTPHVTPILHTHGFRSHLGGRVPASDFRQPLSKPLTSHSPKSTPTEAPSTPAARVIVPQTPFTPHHIPPGISNGGANPMPEQVKQQQRVPTLRVTAASPVKSVSSSPKKKPQPIKRRRMGF